MDYISRQANHYRQKQRPKDPSDLHFDLDEDNIPDDFLQRPKVNGSLLPSRYSHHSDVSAPRAWSVHRATQTTRGLHQNDMDRQSSIWKPSRWTIYGLSVRTNNDCEGWHNRLNSRARPNMPLYLLIKLLNEEALLVNAQVRLVTENKLHRRQRKLYKKLQGKIFGYWKQYAEGDRSAFQLLRACSRIYAPYVPRLELVI